MNEYEMMKQMLSRVDPKQNNWYPRDDEKIIVFPTDDDWYTIFMIFDTKGQLVSFD